jgi:hypothetical protein
MPKVPNAIGHLLSYIPQIVHRLLPIIVKLHKAANAVLSPLRPKESLEMPM